MQQIAAVRGSPLVRFVFLTLALVATGVGLMRVTAGRPAARISVQPTATNVEASVHVPFQLVLSAAATEVNIESEGPALHFSEETNPLAGKLLLDPQNPHVSLVVRWKTPSAQGEHRFAKLTLEAPGKPTFTHVFDADGDIDDFLELPLP